MLARASKRKLKSQHHASLSKQIHSSCQQLRLPWLCPAQLRWIARPSFGTQRGSHDQSRPRQANGPKSRNETRCLATASEAYSPRPDSIPFLNPLPSPTGRPARTVPSFSSINPWDDVKPLVIHEQIAEPPPRLRKIRGIGGDVTELLQNLHACLGVSRWERAAAIVRRVADMFDSAAPEVLEAHTMYLRALVDALCRHKPEVSLKKVQHWFEVEIRRSGVPPTSALLALMCRASLNSLDGKPRSRTVRRYLHLAEEADLLDATMSSGEFPVNEWEELVNIRDDLFAPLRAEDIAGDAESPEPQASSTLQPLSEGAIADALRSDIRAVEQRGLGLTTLKRSLRVVNDGYLTQPAPSLGDHKAGADKISAYARQAEMEENVVDAALERWRAENAQMTKMGISPSLRSKPMGALLWNWHTSLMAEIHKELDEVKKALDENNESNCDRLSYGPYFESISAEKMAATTVVTVLEILVQHGVTEGVWLGQLAKEIGNRLAAEVRANDNYKVMKGRKHVSGTVRHRQKVLQKLYKGKQDADKPLKNTVSETDASDQKSADWPLFAKVQIGGLLIARLLEVAKIEVPKNPMDSQSVKVKELALQHEIKSRKGRPLGVITAHPRMVEMLMKEPPRYAVGARLPMIVPPKPWKGFREGGYLQYSTPVMRSKGNDEVQEMYARAASEKGDLEQLYAGLDVLGRTAWRINQDVLKVVLEAWNTGEAIANIPAENPQLPQPREPDPSEGEKAKAVWRMAIRALENEKAGYHSQRCFFNLQLEIAQAFSNEEFYYPHNVDFRGRAYPISPYFNHMGADHTRGLLMFAKGKELGEVGLKWLKIHLANVFGYDKASLQEREDFTMNHLADIHDSARNPLGGNRWWLKADDPWQCLAACIEIKKAYDIPDPTKFVSHLAVHQDGTCNGLQHYAALGGDTFGAQQVNLEPGDRPADIYTGVAKLVKAAIDRDAEEGNEMANVLQDKITRKVVKQTVMTNVYGVTFVGARAQVQKQLDAIMRNRSQSEVDNYQLSAYIAKKIFQALATMFQGAQAIQFWLGKCADRISTAITSEQIAKIREHQKLIAAPNPKAKGKAVKRSESARASSKKEEFKSLFKSSVIWTTPLKLPVVQPYRNEKLQEIRTVLQSIKMRTPTAQDTVSKRKQLQGFPPNFIHSLDATHMLLSALKCDEIGLTFAAVHDSFWTHASDVPTMNPVLRDAFVKMHSEDIVGRLATEFHARYGNSMYLASVWSRSETGIKIKALRASRSPAKRRTAKTALPVEGRAKSRTIAHNRTVHLTEELLQEHERQEMLRSDDPAAREKAEKMVTPASIFLASDPSSLALPQDEEDVAVSTTAAQESSTAEEEVEEEGLFDSNVGQDSLSPDDTGKKSAARGKKEQKIHVWIPLSFPDVPQRGDWNISRLKDSVYFFS